MSWDVHIVNGHTRRIQVAIKFYQPACGQYGRPWGTKGWWLIEPGQSKYVLDTNNRYFYYYAECVSDGRVWAGDSPTPVYPAAFDSCVSLGSADARDIFMRKRDLEINNWWRLT